MNVIFARCMVALFSTSRTIDRSITLYILQEYVYFSRWHTHTVVAREFNVTVLCMVIEYGGPRRTFKLS